MFNPKVYKTFSIVLFTLLLILTIIDSFIKNLSVEVSVQRIYYAKIILLISGFLLMYLVIPECFDFFTKKTPSYIFSVLLLSGSFLLYYMAGQSVRFNLLSPAVSEEVYFITVKDLAIFNNDYKVNREKLYSSQPDPVKKYSTVLYNDSIIHINQNNYYDTFFFRHYLIDSVTEFKVLNGVGDFLTLQNHSIHIPETKN